MKRLLVVVVVVVVLFAPPCLAQEVEQDFNTRVILKVAELLKTTPPMKIEVEVLSNREMRKALAKHESDKCIRRYNIPPGPGRIQCTVDESSMTAFLYGMWVPENGSYFHVLFNEESGTQTLIHEYMHFWLSNHSDPLGIINRSENVVEALAEMILASPQFADWLEDNR